MLNPPPPSEPVEERTLLQQYLAASDRVAFLRRKDDVELKKLFDEVTRTLIDIAVEARGGALDTANKTQNVV